MYLPDYDFLPAPLWLLTALHVATLTVHLIGMNFLVGGTVVLLWGKFTDRRTNAVFRKFISLFPSIMATTVSFGVAPLLAVQLVYHQQIYSASIVSGWFWLMIIPAAILSYYLMYGNSFGKSHGKGCRAYLGLSLAALLFISLVYSSVFSMAERPDLIRTLYAEDQSGLLINPEIGSWVFRWLHMLAGAIAVGGYFVSLIGRNDEQAFRAGRGFYIWGMVAALASGLLYLLTLGGYTVPFIQSAGFLVLMGGAVLSVVSLALFLKRWFLGASTTLFASFLAMVISRHYLRLTQLQEHFDPSSVSVRPQWTLCLIFLVCLLMAAGLMWYMTRLLVVSKRAADETKPQMKLSGN